MGGDRTYRAPEAYAPTEDHVTFCTQRVVTAALRLAAAETQLAEPPWIDPTIPAWRQAWKTIKTVEGRGRAQKT